MAEAQALISQLLPARFVRPMRALNLAYGRELFDGCPSVDQLLGGGLADAAGG